MTLNLHNTNITGPYNTLKTDSGPLRHLVESLNNYYLNKYLEVWLHLWCLSEVGGGSSAEIPRKGWWMNQPIKKARVYKIKTAVTNLIATPSNAYDNNREHCCIQFELFPLIMLL